MNLSKQKKLVARTLGVSPKRIKLKTETPENSKAIKEVISREGAKELLAEKIITKKPKKGTSRTRANHIANQKKKGRQQGHGSRKGTAKARFDTKERWMIRLRGIRALLSSLREQNRIEQATYRDMYMKAKGNFFRNKRHVLLYIEQNNLLKEKEGALE